METVHLAAFHSLAIAVGHVAAALVFVSLFMVVFVIVATLYGEAGDGEGPKYIP